MFNMKKSHVTKNNQVNLTLLSNFLINVLLWYIYAKIRRETNVQFAKVQSTSLMADDDTCIQRSLQ